jgi:Domain of unknown function (DUF4124)
MNRHSPHPRIIRARVVARAAGRTDDWKRMLPAAGLLLALALTFTAAREAHAVTYKWVDDKGIIHYADKMPAEAVNRGHVELDRQGVSVKKTDPALTPEQVRAQAAETERQKLAVKEREDLARRDRALLASYTREEDIDLARARALKTIEGQMQSARNYNAMLVKREHELIEKKQALAGKDAPPALDREIESVQGEIARSNALLATKKQESLAVAAKFDTEKQRWRGLQTVGEAGNPARSGTLARSEVGGTPANVLPTSGMK